MIKLSADDFTVSVDSKRNFYNIQLRKEPVELECEMAYDQEMEKQCNEVDDTIVFIEDILKDIEDVTVFDDKLATYFEEQAAAIVGYAKDIFRCKNYLKKNRT